MQRRSKRLSKEGEDPNRHLICLHPRDDRGKIFSRTLERLYTDRGTARRESELRLDVEEMTTPKGEEKEGASWSVQDVREPSKARYSWVGGDGFNTSERTGEQFFSFLAVS